MQGVWCVDVLMFWSADRVNHHSFVHFPSMLSINSEVHLLVRFIKLAGLTLRLQLSHHLLKNLHCFDATFPFVTLDVHLNASVGSNSNFKFSFRHTTVNLIHDPLSRLIHP